MAAPKEVAKLAWPSSWSSVDNEPHAFLYWAPKKLAVMPLSSYAYPTSFTGAVGLRVEPGAITEVGRITHKVDSRPENAPVERSLVIGDTLYSLSYLGLSTASVDTLGPLGFTAF
jgi:uncharacterized secreted protein with C-terminal beta-propeller domain